MELVSNSYWVKHKIWIFDENLYGRFPSVIKKLLRGNCMIWEIIEYILVRNVFQRNQHTWIGRSLSFMVNYRKGCSKSIYIIIFCIWMFDYIKYKYVWYQHLPYNKKRKEVIDQCVSFLNWNFFLCVKYIQNYDCYLYIVLNKGYLGLTGFYH